MTRILNPLVFKRRSLSESPKEYGSLYGEGIYTMTTSNYIWPLGVTLREAAQAARNFAFAEWEARRYRGDTRRNGSNRNVFGDE